MDELKECTFFEIHRRNTFKSAMPCSGKIGMIEFVGQHVDTKPPYKLKIGIWYLDNKCQGWVDLKDCKKLIVNASFIEGDEISFDQSESNNIIGVRIWLTEKE